MFWSPFTINLSNCRKRASVLDIWIHYKFVITLIYLWGYICTKLCRPILGSFWPLFASSLDRGQVATPTRRLRVTCTSPPAATSKFPVTGTSNQCRVDGRPLWICPRLIRPVTWQALTWPPSRPSRLWKRSRLAAAGKPCRRPEPLQDVSWIGFWQRRGVGLVCVLIQ